MGPRGASGERPSISISSHGPREAAGITCHQVKRMLFRGRFYKIGPQHVLRFGREVCLFVLTVMGPCCNAWDFSSFRKQGLLSSCGARASHCGDLPWSMRSRAHGLQ